MDATGSFTVLHRFDAYASDGWKPVSGLIEGADGVLYGTAPIGGQPVDADSRAGVVYRMDEAGTVSVVHTFTGQDGARPHAQRPRAVGERGGRTVERERLDGLRSGDGDDPGRRHARLLRRSDEAGQEDEDGGDHGDLQRWLGLGHADGHALSRLCCGERPRAPHGGLHSGVRSASVGARRPSGARASAGDSNRLLHERSIIGNVLLFRAL
jgi:hypothetical protein